MPKDENKFQADLIKEIKDRFPGSIVMKNDANYIQGIPDLTVLYKNKWAALEVKKSEADRKKHPRPNQETYVNKLDKMSFARFIFPENKEEVLDELEQSFKPRRSTRNPSGSK